ncbi:MULTISPECIES: hypothetical protein [Pseudomonas]|uniref:hypothetical protein n=1 Tax=Pseudomonas TaxID=286 RepID=UPI002DBF121F|nr:hypothetical protein [Pseudomonas asiatica]MEB6589208.1 hypothetical protein [Pseudomonas asiatica]
MAIAEFNYFCADAIAVAEKSAASVDDEQASSWRIFILVMSKKVPPKIEKNG